MAQGDVDVSQGAGRQELVAYGQGGCAGMGVATKVDERLGNVYNALGCCGHGLELPVVEKWAFFSVGKIAEQ